MAGFNPMKNRKKVASPDAGQRVRSGYTPPILREFGAVGALTQSGTGAQIEPTNPNGMCVSGPRNAMC